MNLFNENEEEKMPKEENDSTNVENQDVEDTTDAVDEQQETNEDIKVEEKQVVDAALYEPTNRKRSTSSAPAIAILIACVLIFSAVVGLGGWKLYQTISNNSTTGTTQDVTTTQNNTTSTTIESTTSIATGDANMVDAVILPEHTTTSDTSTDVTDMINDCYNSCVRIVLYKNGNKVSAGSGVIYTNDGYIVTNYHVAGNTDLSGCEIKVEIADGTVYSAIYICGDVETDIAVIKIDKNDCHACKIGNSNTTVFGETIYCIGNPNGAGLTVTNGLISRKNVSSTINAGTVTIHIDGLFMISAPINAGNSGGGLFNAKGELIGIVNAKSYYDQSGNAMEGTATAIPIAKAIDCINTLSSNNGYIPGRAKIGVIVSVNGVSIGNGWTSTSYTVVTGVQKGSCSEVAGVQIGDVIFAIDDINLKTYAQEHSLLSDYDAMHYLLMTKYKIGDTAKLTILRPEDPTSTGKVTYNQIELEVTFVDFNYSNIK
ncbi:MAG: S1C family serine protease [Clostridia bacterium]|nr:S1C family serine protease [Clostridia bacterium]